MFCPLIRKNCLKEKCKFWHGLWNSTKGKMEYDCIKIWDINLKIEQIQAMNIKVPKKK